MKGCFQGWYHKHQQGSLVLALIPGHSEDGAFVQIVTGGSSYHIPYPADAFQKAPGEMVHIGDNIFSSRGVHLNIHKQELRLQGDLTYGRWAPLAYDIMGPFRFLPMECRHSVLSMLHRVDGHVTLNGMILDFDGGTGYVEGDSGRSFPSSYSWFQCINPSKGASVMISIGLIPFAGLRFWGCIAAIWLSGREYRLATYLGGRIRHRDERRIVLTQGKWKLEAEILESHGCSLKAPSKGQMSRTINERAAVPARVRFWENEKLLLDEPKGLAGYEFVA